MKKFVFMITVVASLVVTSVLAQVGLPQPSGAKMTADECLRTFPPDQGGGFCEWYGFATSQEADHFEFVRGFQRVKHANGTGDTWQRIDIAELRAELADLKREIRELKNVTGPWPLRVHMQWLPNDPTSVARFKMALGSKYFNHGGLLRVMTTEESIVELQEGEFLTFAAPSWTPVATSVGRRK